MLSAGGGCESAVITRGRTAWGKYRDLLPILSSKNVALRTKGRVYDTCIHSAMLYGSETWAPRNTTDLDRLQRNERGMLRRICRVRPNERVGSAEMCRKLGIGELRPAISQRRLRWFGHVKRSSAWINRCQEIPIVGTRKRGRFSTWIGKVREDLRREGINEADALDRDTWRGHIYSLTNPHP